MEKHRENRCMDLPCYLKARLILPSIGIFVGVTVAIIFSVHFHNYYVASWGFISGLAALLALLVSVGSIKGWFDANPYILKRFMLLGCFIQLAGVCGFVAFMTLAITKHQGLIINGQGYYLTCVWCFMTWKWGFVLFLYSRSFLRLSGINALLVQERKSSYASLTDNAPMAAQDGEGEETAPQDPQV